jgi:hypothetical protein
MVGIGLGGETLRHEAVPGHAPEGREHRGIGHAGGDNLRAYQMLPRRSERIRIICARGATGFSGGQRHARKEGPHRETGNATGFAS